MRTAHSPRRERRRFAADALVENFLEGGGRVRVFDAAGRAVGERVELYSLAPAGKVPPEFQVLAYGRVFGLSVGGLVMLALFVVGPRMSYRPPLSMPAIEACARPRSTGPP